MIKTTKDGRTIRTASAYTMFRLALWEFQEGKCTRCPMMTNPHLEHDADRSFHVHHRNGRGMGGGKRDDTFNACTGLCGKCHRKEHNQ